MHQESDHDESVSPKLSSHGTPYEADLEFNDGMRYDVVVDGVQYTIKDGTVFTEVKTLVPAPASKAELVKEIARVFARHGLFKKVNRHE